MATTNYPNTVNIGTLQIGGTTVTSTAAELNILDGVTSTAAELNILDGVTATAAELNKLDGVNSTTTEIDQRTLSFTVTLGTADDQHIVCPFTGNVTKIYTVIDQALTTADETLTFKNNAGTGMTSGVVTITQSGSADGDIDSATPSANNSFTAGEKITCSIGGENGTAAVCTVTLLIDIT